MLPRILEDLLAQRKATRKMIPEVPEGPEGDFRRAVLDGLQLAYKVTANSLYGQMGARTSPLYLKHIAACTTAVGRSMILQVTFSLGVGASAGPHPEQKLDQNHGDIL